LSGKQSLKVFSSDRYFTYADNGGTVPAVIAAGFGIYGALALAALWAARKKQ